MELSSIVIVLVIALMVGLVIVAISRTIVRRAQSNDSLSRDGGVPTSPTANRPSPTPDRANPNDLPVPQARPDGTPLPPQPTGTSRGGYPTGPTPASGGYTSPPSRERSLDDDQFTPGSASNQQPAQPVIKPLPPADMPSDAKPPSQWQNAEPPPSPTPPTADEDDAREILLEPSTPESAKTADDTPKSIDNESAPVLEREESQPEAQPMPKSEVNFTAFYPRTAQATTRYGLFIYAHLPTALPTIQTDAQKFTQELGGNVPVPRTTKQPTLIAEGQPITVTPECEGLMFDPPTLTKRWDAPYIRYQFDFKPTVDQIGDELQGRVRIDVSGIEIAAPLKFTIEVIALEEPASPAPNANALVGQPPPPPNVHQPMNTNLTAPTNPLAAAKQLAQSEPAKVYTSIFVSYSRKDTAVVEAYRAAQSALGNTVFMDTDSIRAGQNWRVALAKAIDTVDVFQLFWSENSASSTNVRDEWDYALQYRCPDSRCDDFIRPVFWKPPSPTPPPPPELSHLNFRYVPLTKD